MRKAPGVGAGPDDVAAEGEPVHEGLAEPWASEVFVRRDHELMTDRPERRPIARQSGPLQSKGKYLLDLPLRLQLKPKASA